MADAPSANALDFWSDTIKAYEPLHLPYPELTVKRLQKPPFRFIYDIVTAINMRFSAYDHVIPDEFNDSSNIDTKEKKIEYLRILIDYVSKLLNITLSVNPKKVISGHEPEKTNLFLQCLANACRLAQQDRVKANTRQSNSVVPTEPESNPLHVSSPMKVAAFEGRELLPRRKKSSQSALQLQESCNQAIANSKAFTIKLSALSINVQGKEQQSIKEMGNSIVNMWKELQNPKTDVAASPLAKDALAVAIKRQMDKLKQLQELIKESDVIIDNLESFLV
ncbi:unnamed protein product [Phytomonas sp. EM1]|nr:unnamed protein product [Phytomonas sp. EM1]|eukprot:CCW62798.1 unnamed protein product [Phytomonas sp. isolate EM1]